MCLAGRAYGSAEGNRKTDCCHPRLYSKECTALSPRSKDVSGEIFVNGLDHAIREGAGGGTLALGMSCRGCINAGC